MVDTAGLHVDAQLAAFLLDEALPGSGVEPAVFFDRLAAIVHELGPRNRALLDRRDELQAQIDAWHRTRRDAPHDPVAYRAFLEEIGYIVPPGAGMVTLATEGVDAEIATVAGPQLVVPATNARYAINAANARWGSLYDALYGTDAVGSPPPPGPYDPARGAEVIAWARAFLDDVAPLVDVSHADVTAYAVVDGALRAEAGSCSVALADPGLLAGFTGNPAEPESVLLRHHDLHLQIVIDRSHPVGASDRAGIADVVLESAITTIVDLEDSVATVDAADKVEAYRTWLGLVRGDLIAHFDKGGRTVNRRLAPPLTFVRPDDSPGSLPGSSLLLVRNVGHLMTTDAVLDRDGHPVGEGLLDAMVTVLAACHDLRRSSGDPNSRTGSVYVVKPKMHGPAEVAFTDALFDRVEDALGLPRHTVKIGLMDEERRTTVNLAECLRAAHHRIAFINTGFLDRTGDEMHTSMHAGPMVRKESMRSQRWLAAYEDHNVDVGLAAGMSGRAQIGKGMWAAPDQMAKLLRDKIAHPEAGANCAWVPSPTAATLHATHYHRVDVRARQRQIAAAGARTTVDDLLAIPLAVSPAWSTAEIDEELDNNAQGILGYVVRWVDQGIGCSKVPDIHDVALMEDRATCRISSQHIANWLLHGVVDRSQVDASMQRMARVVDAQNADDPDYSPMAPTFDGPAFRAACDLVFSGTEQPAGYTEPILHARRLERKSQQAEVSVARQS